MLIMTQQNYYKTNISRRKTREYYEKLYTSKFENINKMDKFLKG